MKIGIEIRLAILGICTLLVLIWGINYLKGRNIFQPTSSYHAYFENSGGLEESAPVLLNGMKVGYVDQLVLNLDNSLPVEAILVVERDYPLPVDSRAILSSADLLGSKAIVLEPGSSGRILQSGDTLESFSSPDLLTRLENSLMPVAEKFGSLASSLDSLSWQLSDMLASEELEALVQNLSGASLELRSVLGKLDAFSSMLNSNEEEISETLENLAAFSNDLRETHLDSLALEFGKVAGELNATLEQVNSGQGDAGRFIYSDSLYIHLDALVKNLDTLVQDLNENPEDYVQISVFGKSRKK